MDVSRFSQPTEFDGDDDQDSALCRELFNRAGDYIRSFDWCSSIKASYVGDCVGGIIALVLFQIEPASADVDEWIWVVVGDLPSAYIAPASPSPRDALEDYIEQMSKWVDAIRAGRPVTELIPLNTPPTRDWADSLGQRLHFLRNEILPFVEEREP